MVGSRFVVSLAKPGGNTRERQKRDWKKKTVRRNLPKLRG
jgi:hypothetical protein